MTEQCGTCSDAADLNGDLTCSECGREFARDAYGNLHEADELFVTDDGIVPTCDICDEPQSATGDDWNGDTGNHRSCEEFVAVDITPKWSALLPGMLAVLANPDAPFGSRRLVEQELARMARAADLYNFIQNEA
jgi:hypothetical protein